MRKLTFSWYDRLVLIPVEVVLELRLLALVSGIILLICAILNSLPVGLTAFGAYTGAVLSGVALGPLLLPLLPSRSFAIKGAVIGFIWTLIYFLLTGANWNLLTIIAAFLALPAVSAFYTLNFTGCTTYTSRSGVKKEMKVGLPIMGCAVVVAILLLLLGRIA
jgi:acetyl-CoA decarbonylase/synthase complex subunit gamma